MPVDVGCHYLHVPVTIHVIIHVHYGKSTCHTLYPPNTYDMYAYLIREGDSVLWSPPSVPTARQRGWWNLVGFSSCNQYVSRYFNSCGWSTKTCCVKYSFTLLIINLISICNPRTTPPPSPEFSGNWKLWFSGGYLSVLHGGFCVFVSPLIERNICLCSPRGIRVNSGCAGIEPQSISRMQRAMLAVSGAAVVSYGSLVLASALYIRALRCRYSA